MTGHNAGTRAAGWWVLVATCGSLLASLGHTQSTQTLESTARLSLTEVRRLAFLNNWDLLAAKSDLDVAKAQQIVAREFPNPTLSISSSKINVDRANGTSLGNGFFQRSYDNIAAVNQLLEIGGKRSSRRAAAEAGSIAAEARFRDARRVLDLGVTTAYLAVLQNLANADILQQSAASLRKEADIAAVRLNTGDISASDEAQIEVAAARLEQDARAADNSARTSRITLDTLLGVRVPTGNWQPSDSLETLASSLSSGVKDAPLAAVELRPDVVAADEFTKQADANLRLQKSLRIPDPTVSVQYEREPPGALQTVGFGLSFPLPLWNRNRGNITAAEAAKRQAAVQAEKIRGQAAAEVASARLNYEAASERYQRYQSQIAPRSAKVRESVAFAYQKGGASLLDLLNAERTDNEVRLATAQATADAAIAAASLKAALNLVERESQP